MQSMIFAAGLGTRLKPLTDTQPKAMVRVADRALLEHTILRLKDAGCRKIIVNVHHFSEQIVDFLRKNNYDLDISISDETSQLLDTGGGIKHALRFVDTRLPLLIHNVDILSNIDLAAFYAQAVQAMEADAADAMLIVSKRKTSRYLIFDDEMRLVGWTHIGTGEVKSPFSALKALTFSPPYDAIDYQAQHGYHLLAFSGVHTLLPKALEKIGKEEADRFSIIDFYLKHAAQLQLKGVLKTDLKLLDVGKTAMLQQAADFAKEQGYV